MGMKNCKKRNWWRKGKVKVKTGSRAAPEHENESMGWGL
jgi:hypothetical protein